MEPRKHFGPDFTLINRNTVPNVLGTHFLSVRFGILNRTERKWAEFKKPVRLLD